MNPPIYWLDDDPALFPHPSQALLEPNGLLAAGGDLSPQRLLSAYSQGIFPWYNEGEPILWWSPSPRCVIRPSEFYPAKSLRKLMRKNVFEVTINQSFKEVMVHCATARAEGTWINQDMIQAYCQLNKQGVAHSFECRLDGVLVGGLYGIAIGGVFFGESMFSTISNSSKIAFDSLCEKLTKWGFTLIDCQVYSEHLESLGAYEISQEAFLEELQVGITTPSKPEWPNV